jgi:hypothetical protein
MSHRIIGRVKPRHPLRISLGRHFNRVRWDHIFARFNPTAPVAFAAELPLGPLARQVNFAIPLPMSGANGAQHIQVTLARQNGNSVQRVGIPGASACDNSFFVGHRQLLLFSRCLV